jgi:hypothetical protein
VVTVVFRVSLEKQLLKIEHLGLDRQSESEKAGGRNGKATEPRNRSVNARKPREQRVDYKLDQELREKGRGKRVERGGIQYQAIGLAVKLYSPEFCFFGLLRRHLHVDLHCTAC